MRANGSSDSCSSSVLIEARAGLPWAPLTGAAMSGVCVALAAAALLCACHRKRLWDISALCAGVRRPLVECDDQSDGVSESTGVHSDPQPVDGAEPQWTVNSDVAAFALKARVVYPINQRHRPLADGASNPSLHEPLKHQPPLSLDSASSLTDDWLSQEREDDDSSQFMSCGPSSKTHASHMFQRVQHYPQTPCHSRVSLLNLTLQELQIHTSELQQQKYRMFLHVLRVLLSGKENADAIHDQQRQGVEPLLRGVSVDEGAEPHTLMCSVEEVERTGREQLERSVQMAVSFAQQLQRLIQDLQRSGVSEEVMRSVLVCLRVMEGALAEVQESVLKMLLDRFLCWQEVSDSLRERTALSKQEAELLLKAAGQSVEPLRADGQMEKQSVGVLETALHEALEQCITEVRHQTEQLALSHCQKACVRRRRMMKAQSAECSRGSETQTDTRDLMKAFAELQTNHWRQRREFELQQDSRVIEALCGRWTGLYSQCSGRLADLCTEFVLSSVTAGSAPSADHCQALLKRMMLAVTNQMQREERHAHERLRTVREQLQRRRQVWLEDEALTRSCLDHFGEQQRRLFSLASADTHSDALTEEQQHLLILELQRILSARCFYLRSVREMKLTVHSEAQESHVAMETIPSEEAVIGQNPLDEQLSELEEAADVLQGHAHFLLGHALCGGAQLQISGVWRDRRAKERLMDAVCESVYVSRDSLVSLVRHFYSQIQKRRQASLRSAPEDADEHNERMACTKAIQTELINWARKPRSPELQHRVVELKRTRVSEVQKSQHSPEQTLHYRQLREEEVAFIHGLASLARVSLSSVYKDDVTGEAVE